MTWTLVLLLASGEMSSGHVDPYRCRQTEMRIASGWVGHYSGIRIRGAVCLRKGGPVIASGVPA